MKTDLFHSCGPCWLFKICWHIECNTLTVSSFRIWNSSTGIPSPPLTLFVVMLPKAHLTSLPGWRWVITPSWSSGSWRSFSLSHVWLFATPWTTAHQASLSTTHSQSLLKLMSVTLVMPSNHLIFCHRLLLPPSIFSSIRIFSNESALRIRWPKYWSFSFSISPSNEYSGLISFRMDWLDLLAVQGTLESLLQHHRSKASILWCSAFFLVQLSHPHMTAGKTIALTKQTSVGPFEGGGLHLHCLHYSLALGQTTGREHSHTHQQKNGLKIYWEWPHPSKKDPISPTVSLFHQEASISLLSLLIRGQTEWKSQSQKINQTDPMGHSLV